MVNWFGNNGEELLRKTELRGDDVAVTGTFDAEARRASMTDELIKRGTLTLNQAAKTWDVHQMTIRRDFDAFVMAGIARRVRGGVVALSGDDFTQRKYQNAGAKRQVADKLRTLIKPDMAIALDSSTTIHSLAEQLMGVSRISVVTNGLSAFQTLNGREGIRSYLTGGERDEQNISLVGSLAVQAVQRFSLDICFLSTLNIDPVFGTSKMTMEQVAVKQAMVDASQTAVLAVDSSKFDTRARIKSLPLSGFDILVTELDSSDPRLDAYRNQVPNIL
jgi:DeoR family fructose operon transcriptional repressor